MKILFLTSTLGYGGAAKMLAFVANNLQEEKNDVHVIGYLCKDAVPVFDKDINLHFLGTILKKGEHLRILRVLYKKIKQISPDLIISFLTFPNLYSVILGKVLRIPVIISERGNPYTAVGFKMKVIYNIINHADGAVFQTEGAKSFFSVKMQKKSVVIPNPVVKRNNSVRYDINCDNYDIVFVGRLENKQKRLDILFDALGYVIDAYSDARLLVYGSGEDENMLRAMASRLEFSNGIKFMGSTSDPEKAMSQAMVYVISSDYEGIPNSLIEAMSIGMPVVATDCDPGGARLLIENGVNGFVVPKGNAKAIAEAVITLFRNKDLRCIFSRNAEKICEQYSETGISSMWNDYIVKVVTE